MRVDWRSPGVKRHNLPNDFGEKCELGLIVSASSVLRGSERHLLRFLSMRCTS